jgi:hypothetical protein
MKKFKLQKEDILEKCLTQPFNFDNKQNTVGLINDFHTVTDLSKSLLNSIEFESMEITVGSTHRMSFKTIMEDFGKRGKKLLKCEDILLFFVDQQAKELVDFKSNSEISMYKFQELFKY